MAIWKFKGIQVIFVIFLWEISLLTIKYLQQWAAAGDVERIANDQLRWHIYYII